jgi:hypothetical protein
MKTAQKLFHDFKSATFPGSNSAVEVNDLRKTIGFEFLGCTG